MTTAWARTGVPPMLLFYLLKTSVFHKSLSVYKQAFFITLFIFNVLQKHKSSTF